MNNATLTPILSDFMVSKLSSHQGLLVFKLVCPEKLESKLISQNSNSLELWDNNVVYSVPFIYLSYFSFFLYNYFFFFFFVFFGTDLSSVMDIWPGLSVHNSVCPEIL